MSALLMLLLTQAPTTAGAVTTPFPTFENLSIEWAISGDDDLDGVVSVRYRTGGGRWRRGLPLRRVPAGTVENTWSWTNKHSGSLFDLVPGTTYEIELTLVDPDGGGTTRTVMASTRTPPAVPQNANVRPVTPSTLAAALSSASPGDVLRLADGVYPPITITRDGADGRFCWLVAENPGQAVVMGEVRLDGRAFWGVSGLRINGQVKFNNAHDIAIVRNTIRTATSGVVAYDTTTNRTVYNVTVTDNDIEGSTTWSNATVGANGNNLGEGIELTGAGHVIAWNRVKGFRDCISTLEDGEAKNQTSVDIIGNDLEIGADDAIEMDFTMGNVRVLRNRIRNSFVGISGQPTLGGPLYAVRNVMFNVVYSPFKLHRGGAGDVALHNTVVKTGDAFAIYASVPWARAFFRNNLFLGGTGGGTYGGFGNGTGRVADLGQSAPSCSYDYDGFGSIGTGSFQGRIGSATFSSLATLRSMTSEVHAQQVDLSIFASAVTFPASPFPEQPAPDLRLGSASNAVDTGLELAGINEGALGAAPDLGAYEVGALQPTYGPRPLPLTSRCGDHARELSEACDDGNTRAGDGCSASCALEADPMGGGSAGGATGGGATTGGGFATGGGAAAGGGAPTAGGAPTSGGSPMAGGSAVGGGAATGGGSLTGGGSAGGSATAGGAATSGGAATAGGATTDPVPPAGCGCTSGGELPVLAAVLAALRARRR